MSAQVESSQTTEQKSNDKELNFRALETKFQKQIEQEKAEKAELLRQIEEIRQRQQQVSTQEEDDDSEPYVDHKRLEKKLSSFEKKFDERIEKKAEEKARALLDNEKRNTWFQSNPDFYDVMQHAEKLAQKNPQLAESILQMPDGFERQKLVYSNIKALGLDRPEMKQPSIQDKVDQNRKMPYYQPSGVANAPYANQGDFSASGQKNAYEKMKELQKRLAL